MRYLGVLFGLGEGWFRMWNGKTFSIARMCFVGLAAGIVLWLFNYNAWRSELYTYPWPNFVAENGAFILAPVLILLLARAVIWLARWIWRVAHGSKQA